MSLLRYEEALPWVNAMKLRVLERRMPPWLPAEGVGRWRGERGLSAPELDVLVEWASGGAPLGEGPAEDPKAGPPLEAEAGADLVLTAQRETVLGSAESEREVCVTFEPRLPGDRLLAAVALRPGNPSLVRRAVIYRGDACREGAPLATWLPGDAAFEMPKGAAEFVRGGALLSARILYRKPWRLDGRSAGDRSRLALRFAHAGTPVLRHLELEDGRARAFPRGARVVAVFPSGSKGTSLRLEAAGPRGAPEPVFVAEAFDPSWAAKYVRQEALGLAAGTRLVAVSGDFWVDYLDGPGAALKAAPPRAAPGGSP
jgi:hypothetical protein